MSECSLLQLADSCLAQSFLTFLVADLRLLSATGRISTRYEHLAIDSDHVAKASARHFCGYSTIPETSGLCPAQIMAVLLLEISKEVELSKDESSTTENRLLTKIETRQAGKAQVEMHTLLKGYADMITQDLAGDGPKVKKSIAECILPPVTEEDEFREKSFKKEFETSFISLDGDFDDLEYEGEDEELFRVPGRLKRAKSFTRPLAKIQEKKNKKVLEQFEGIQNSVFREHTERSEEYYGKEELKTLMEKAVASRDRNRLSFMKDFFREGTVSRTMAESTAELVWLQDWHSSKVRVAVVLSTESTSHSHTRAVRNVFTPFPSIMKRRLSYSHFAGQSPKPIGVSYRHCCFTTKREPFNDRDSRLCLRQGHIWDWNPTRAINPIKEHYPGRLSTIKMHNGFHRYLFRQRKDTGTTKYDEIATKVDHYMNQVGEGCKLLVTGHSLVCIYR